MLSVKITSVPSIRGRSSREVLHATRRDGPEDPRPTEGRGQPPGREVRLPRVTPRIATNCPRQMPQQTTRYQINSPRTSIHPPPASYPPVPDRRIPDARRLARTLGEPAPSPKRRGHRNGVDDTRASWDAVHGMPSSFANSAAPSPIHPLGTGATQHNPPQPETPAGSISGRESAPSWGPTGHGSTYHSPSKKDYKRGQIQTQMFQDRSNASPESGKSARTQDDPHVLSHTHDFDASSGRGDLTRTGSNARVVNDDVNDALDAEPESESGTHRLITPRTPPRRGGARTTGANRARRRGSALAPGRRGADTRRRYRAAPRGDRRKVRGAERRDARRRKTPDAKSGRSGTNRKVVAKGRGRRVVVRRAQAGGCDEGGVPRAVRVDPVLS